MPNNPLAVLVEGDDRTLLALMAAIVFTSGEAYYTAVGRAAQLLAAVDKHLASAVQQEQA